MSQPDAEKQLKAWIRSQHLICEGTDFIFETVDQTQLEKFEHCIELIGGRVRKIAAAGNWQWDLGAPSKSCAPQPQCRDRGEKL